MKSKFFITSRSPNQQKRIWSSDEVMMTKIIMKIMMKVRLRLFQNV